jgi:hypothetical protein
MTALRQALVSTAAVVVWASQARGCEIRRTVTGWLQAFETAGPMSVHRRDWFPEAMLLIAPVGLVTVIAGCATLPNGRRWGEDATIVPGWERVRASAIKAASDPWGMGASGGWRCHSGGSLGSEDIQLGAP